MSQLTSLSQLEVYMFSNLPGCRDEVLLLELQNAARELCQRSEAFKDDLDKIPVVDFQQFYTLTPPYGYTAQIKRILEVKVDGVVQPVSSYELYQGNKLKWLQPNAPNNQTNQLLRCGTSGNPLYTAWTGITNASFGFYIEPSTTAVTSVSFAAATSMYDVAEILQTAIRTAIDDPEGFCQWSGTRFNFWVSSGTIGYITAGTTGTDISGASYLNGLTGSATLAGLLEVKAAFSPDFSTDIVPDWFLDMWGKGIKGKAEWDLARQPRKSWTNAVIADAGRIEWYRSLSGARREDDVGYKNGLACVTG